MKFGIKVFITGWLLFSAYGPNTESSNSRIVQGGYAHEKQVKVVKKHIIRHLSTENSGIRPVYGRLATCRSTPIIGHLRFISIF